MRTLAALALLLTLAACGGTSSGSGPGEEPSEPRADSVPKEPIADALSGTVQAYSDAFLTGKGAAAYGLLSERCRAEVSLQEFGAVVKQAGRLYGTPLPFTSYSDELTGTRALVTYGYQAEAINQTNEPWVFEQKSWRNDDC